MGEFILNRLAVQSAGLDYLNQLNQGRVFESESNDSFGNRNDDGFSGGDSGNISISLDNNAVVEEIRELRHTLERKFDELSIKIERLGEEFA